MEKSEPSLIPEWLKSNGTISGGNGLNQHSSSSLSHSDDWASRHRSRSKYSFGNGGYDSPRSVISDPSHFSKKPGSNGSMMHVKNHQLRPYNSFGRSRDKDWGSDLFDCCDKERWFQNDRRDRHSTPFGVSANPVNNGTEKGTLRRSMSMISGKQDDSWSKRKAMDLNTRNNGDASNAGGNMDDSVHKSAFERDFPSIGADERPGTPDIVRASSPSLSTSVQSFPVSVSHVNGGEGWNSALAEMRVAAGSNNTVSSSVQPHAPTTVTSTAVNGLSMAETLAQVPSRAQSSPQVSLETQRLEELAIKQSRQLIPVTSLLPKTSASKLEKLKPKPASRSDMNPASKVGHQQLSAPRPVSNTILGGPAKSDVATSHATKFSVLFRPAQERNGVSIDKENPPNSATIPSNPPVAPVVAPARPANNYGLLMEKRPTVSQAQSRNDFFKHMRNKSSTTLSTTTPVDPKCSSLPTVLESSGTADVISHVNCDDSSDVANGVVTHVVPFEDVHPEEEEERAFLRSLGWDENAGDDEGLTEEEITAFNAFYKEYIQVKPALKMNATKSVAPMMSSHVDVFDSDDETSSSDSDADA